MQFGPGLDVSHKNVHKGLLNFIHVAKTIGCKCGVDV